MEREKNRWDDLFGKGSASATLFQKEFKAPTSQCEQELARMWQELLQYDKVSMDDNFLDLGGNSLLLAQLLSRIGDTYNISLTFKELLLTQLTVQEQARLVESALLGQADPHVLKELMAELGLSHEELTKVMDA